MGGNIQNPLMDAAIAYSDGAFTDANFKLPEVVRFAFLAGAAWQSEQVSRELADAAQALRAGADMMDPRRRSKLIALANEVSGLEHAKQERTDV